MDIDVLQLKNKICSIKLKDIEDFRFKHIYTIKNDKDVILKFENIISNRIKEYLVLYSSYQHLTNNIIINLVYSRFDKNNKFLKNGIYYTFEEFVNEN